MRLILSCVSFDNEIDLDEPDNDRAVTPAIRMRFECDPNAIRMQTRPNDSADMPAITTRRWHRTATQPLLLRLQLNQHLAALLQLIDSCCPACS
jgi:hypothetical protein